MPKFADIFQENDTPYPCSIVGIKEGVKTQYGDQFVITIEHEGEEFEWFCKPETYERVFLDDSGAAKFAEGEQVYITKNSPKGKSKFPFYTVDPMDGSAPAPTPKPAATKAPVADAPAPSQPAAPAAKPLGTHGLVEDLKDRRISIAGYTQSCIERGMDIEEAKRNGLALAKWARQAAYEWQQEDNVNAVFSGQE